MAQSHLSTLLNRQGILVKRNKCRTLAIVSLMILYMFMAIMIRLLVPVETIPQSTHHEYIQLVSTLDQADKINFADQCLDQNATIIALVDAPSQIQSTDLNLSPSQRVFEILQNKMTQNNSDLFIPKHFDSIDDLEDYQEGSFNIENGLICFAIQINEASELSQNISIRFSKSFLPDLNKNQTHYDQAVYDFESYQMYKDNGFLQIMGSATQSILTTLPQKQDFEIQFLPTETPEIKQDKQAQILTMFLTMTLCQIPWLPLILDWAIRDSQEEQIFGLSQQMGLNIKTVIASQLISLTVFILVLSAPIFVIIKVFFLPKSSLMILFITVALSSYGTLLANFLFTTVMGPTFTIIYVVIQFIKAIIIDPVSYSSPFPGFIAYPLTLVLPQTAITQVMRITFQSEMTFENGLDWSKINMSINRNTVLFNILSLIVCNVLMSCLITLFAVNRKNGCCKRSRQGDSKQIMDFEKNQLLEEEKKLIQSGDYEMIESAQSQNESDALKISKLTKKFKLNEKSFNAVDELSLSIFKGQIFVLLGHNGAGKTTTIKMLTGSLSRTSGSASVFGIDMFQDKDKIQKMLGICPQQNILNSQLSVKENLEYFCGLRQLTDSQISSFIDEMLPKVDLDHKRDAIVETLSGGQKRKVQLLIALAGETRIILLDEPSSGMDPTSRRQTWNLIQDLKKDKIIILTTHYMDEADELGDRIAILSCGKLKVCGSSLFLKQKYGLGTILEIEQVTKCSQMKELEDLIKSFEEGIQLNLTQNTIMNQSENQQLSSGFFDDSTNLFTMNLPSHLYPHFEDIFKEVDKNPSKYNISTYNLRVTSLEEVFNTIGEQELKKLNESDEQSSQLNLSIPQQNKEDVAQDYYQNDNLNDSRNIDFIPRNSKRGPVKIIIYLFRRKMMVVWRKRDVIKGSCIVFVMCIIMSMIVFDDKVGSFNLSQPNVIFKDLENQFKIAYSFEEGKSSQMNQRFLESKAFNSVTSQKIDFDQESEPLENEDKFSSLSLESETIFNGGIYLQNSETQNKISAFVLSNQSAPADLTLMAALTFESLIQANSEETKDFQLTFINDPLPDVKLLQQASLSFNTFTFSSMMPCFIIPASILSLIERFNERHIGLETQLKMAGVLKSQLFISELLIDFLLHIIYVSIILTSSKFVMDYDLNGFFLPLCLFSVAQPLMNAFYYSCFEKTPKTGKDAFVRYFMRAFCLVMIGCTVIGILGIESNEHGQLLMAEYVLSLIPHFAIIQSFIKILYRAKYYEGSIDPFTNSGCLPQLKSLSVSIILYPLLTLLNISCKKEKQNSISKKNINELTGDEDVMKEKSRVEHLLQDYDTQKQSLTVHKLQKSYGNVEAIKEISFSFEKRNKDRFILLGLNGAGKSTTFKCLTGEERASNGAILINGVNINLILENPQQFKNFIGYCPQNDCVSDFLTVQETLKFFGKIRGLINERLDQYVEQQMLNFKISKYSKQLVGNLSGGNKRKLVTALAMLQRPSIILLDESSSGVDPFARRQLWKTIKDEARSSTLVVTTHSMEEAEALHTKIAIMVKGELKCFGTSQELKDRYGQGFSLQIKIKHSSPNQGIKFVLKPSDFYHEVLVNTPEFKDYKQMIDELFEQGIAEQCSYRYEQDLQELLIKACRICISLKKTVGEVTLTSLEGNLLSLKLDNNKNLSIGFIFGFLHQIQKELEIVTFNASKTSLEEVFNSFAKQQSSAKLISN